MNRRTFVKATGATAITATAFPADAATAHVSFDLAKDLIMAWREKSIEGVLARLTDDIVWYSHVGTAPKIGKAQVKAFLDVFAGSISEVKWRIFGYAISGQQIFLEGADDFVLLPEKRRVGIPYAGVLTFRGNLISEWRDYFDRNLFDKLKAGEPTPPEIQKLLDRPALF
ncbi:MAG: limonene-1,2-epoxide hydrolase family protein [Vicinamibacteria bacterium]